MINTNNKTFKSNLVRKEPKNLNIGIEEFLNSVEDIGRQKTFFPKTPSLTQVSTKIKKRRNNGPSNQSQKMEETLCKLLDRKKIDDEQLIRVAVDQFAVPALGTSIRQQINEQTQRLVQPCITVDGKKSFFTNAVQRSMKEVSLKSFCDKNVKQPQIDYATWNPYIF